LGKKFEYANDSSFKRARRTEARPSCSENLTFGAAQKVFPAKIKKHNAIL